VLIPWYMVYMIVECVFVLSSANCGGEQHGRNSSSCGCPRRGWHSWLPASCCLLGLLGHSSSRACCQWAAHCCLATIFQCCFYLGC
jgi:hypothetical protein